MFSSAAAGGSLIVASLLLVVAVSAIIGVRGFRSARDVAPPQSVVVQAGKADDREAGAAPSSTPVVIGGSRRSTRSAQPAGRAAGKGTRRRARPAAGSRRSASPSSRSGHSSGTRARTTPAATAQSSAPEPAPAATRAPAEHKSPASPVQEAVNGATGAVDAAAKKPVESVGDVLLDLRDALP